MIYIITQLAVYTSLIYIANGVFFGGFLAHAGATGFGSQVEEEAGRPEADPHPSRRNDVTKFKTGALRKIPPPTKAVGS